MLNLDATFFRLDVWIHSQNLDAQFQTACGQGSKTRSSIQRKERPPNGAGDDLQCAIDHAVQCGGQEAMPNFKLKPASDWPKDDVLDAVRAEYGRRDAARPQGAKLSGLAQHKAGTLSCSLLFG